MHVVCRFCGDFACTETNVRVDRPKYKRRKPGLARLASPQFSESLLTAQRIKTILAIALGVANTWWVTGMRVYAWKTVRAGVKFPKTAGRRLLGLAGLKNPQPQLPCRIDGGDGKLPSTPAFGFSRRR